MTDHKIQRPVESSDYLAPLAEMTPTLTGLEFLMPEKAPEGDEGEIYKAVVMTRSKPMPNYVDYLAGLLARSPSQESQPYFDLIQGQLMLKRYDDALKSLASLMAREPDNFRLWQWQGTALMGLKQYVEAKQWFIKALGKKPDMPELHFNLALAHYATDDKIGAKASFELALALRPTMFTAHFYLGQLSKDIGDNSMAAQHFVEALAINPLFERGYLAVAEAYQALGQNSEAVRYLKHGLTVVGNKTAIEQALNELSLQNQD